MTVGFGGPLSTLGPAAAATLGALVLVAAAVGSMALGALFLLHLPATYFADDDRAARRASGRPVLSWAALVLKNCLGVVLVGLGVVLLFTPGQGILTILVGVMLLDFPGKRRLERKLITRPRVLETVNRLRARFARPPLIIGEGRDRGIAPGSDE